MLSLPAIFILAIFVDLEESILQRKNSSMLCSGEPSLLIRGASKSFTHIYSVIIFSVVICDLY